MRSLPSPGYLLSRLLYEPETGNLIWKPLPSPIHRQKIWNARYAGTIAGKLDERGYRIVFIDYKPYKAHRLIWTMVMGEAPPGQIDHINGDKDDNRLVNLRLANNGENQRNVRRRRDNKTGFKGVGYRKDTGRFIAMINVDGERHYLGQFDTPEEAYAARCSIIEGLHGEFANTG